MSSRRTDRKKLEAELWKQASILHNLLLIDLSGIPDGQVITKHSTQHRTLTNGEETVYKYLYEVLDIFGGKQIHLPSRKKARYQKENDERWKLCDAVLYKNEKLQQIKAAKEQVKYLISAVNSHKNSKEERETYENIMERVKIAADNKQELERKKSSKTENPNHDPTFDINGLIVTNLGEGVRSKNECIFADKLQEMGIAYMYEMEITNVALPDFTVLIGKEVYFIEILGKMDDKKYRSSLENKIIKYQAANICLGKNLVLIDVTLGISVPILEKIILDLMAGTVPDRIVRGYNTEEYEKKQKRISEYEQNKKPGN